MNVTDKEIKCCQPLKEGLLQKDSSESERYAGVYNSLKITENNIANANESKERLLEGILDRDNLNKAYKRVKSNKGCFLQRKSAAQRCRFLEIYCNMNLQLVK
jgi:RNA-directed DNA polymerase